MKQYSESCDQNRDPILAILRKAFAGTQRVLEIGSGTGQHAVYFARHLPHLSWQTSDKPEYHASIHAWIADSSQGTVLPPLELDVTVDQWPQHSYDGLFSANTTHIMGWPAVQRMFEGIGRILEPGAAFCLYGPFNYGNRYTSESNERFDAWLKDRDAASGIRNFEDLNALAERNGLRLEADHEMPANNRLLVWVKQPQVPLNTCFSH
jgi:cyclopropane fatty-acyl-phospholipid synthase-like methyltransferase